MKIRLRHGLAKTGALGLVGVTAIGLAVPGLASASPATYTAHAESAGAVINVFGTELTGGTASATVDTSVPSASAEGTGTLTPALVEDQKANASGAGTSQNNPKACSQGASLPSSAPVGVTLGLACSSATAAIDSSGAPTASATGEIAGLNVNVSSLLNQILSSGGDQLFSGIQQILGQLNGTPLGTGSTTCPDSSVSASSTTQSNSASTASSGNPLSALAGTASVPGSPLNDLLGSLGLGSSTASSSPGPLGNLLQGLCQTLTNIENVVKGTNAPPTLVVDIGPASASVTGTDSNTARATAEGETADIQVLPGVGCDASSLTACVTNASAYSAPLIEIKIAPAQATDVWDGTRWTPSNTSALATIDLNVPGDAQSISVAGGQSLDLLAGTPLETVIDLGSASTTGGVNPSNGTSANGATIDVAKGINGGILADLGSSSVIGGDSPATLQSVTHAVPKANNPTPSAPSPTLVHTGAWWSGSLPFLAAFAALGAGLLGWPRFRRTAKGLGTRVRAARR